MARQYNLKNLNGIHLKAPYDYTSYNANGINALIEDYDFHPYRSNDLSNFEFINGSYKLVSRTSINNNMPMGNGFIGNNSSASRTIPVNYTQFKKLNTLVKGEVYYTNFDMYFNFNGDGQNYSVGSNGYTIAVDIYAVLGNNKKKLKLSDLKVYDYASATYSGSTSNPVVAGYVDISTSFFDNWVDISSDTINVSYLPHPHVYDVIKTGGGSMVVSWIEGNASLTGYATTKIQSITEISSNNITSFTRPVVTPFDFVGPEPEFDIQDQGLAEEPNISPFNFMSGYMFKVTAELDTSTEELFNSNTCTGNKEFKIIVDYNGTISQTTVEYVPFQEDIAFIDPGDLPQPIG
jgi:hypothetical protein